MPNVVSASVSSLVPSSPAANENRPRTPVPLAAHRRVADQIVEALYRAGVRTVFGVPGGAIGAIYDALLDEPRIQLVQSSHESGAVFAAAAHARASGTVGVVLVTSGPGVTNALTGLASAYCDSLPVLVLAGEVPRKNYGKGALQEGSPYHLNLVGMLRFITKLATEVGGPESAVGALRRGISTAMSGKKGPVFLSVPLDVQTASAPVPRMAVDVEARFRVDRSVVEAAVGRLAAADRPLLLAGSGCRWGKGPESLRHLAERLNIPVATTPKGKGVFPESHPLSLGIFGYGGHPSATGYAAQGIDVLLAVGTSLGDIATNNWSSNLAAPSVIQVDVDSAQVGKNYAVELGLVGPAEEILPEMAALCPPRASKRGPFGRTTFKPAQDNPGERITPQRAIWELQQLLPTSAIYASDIGEHLMFALHYLTVDRPDGFYASTGLSSMGSSLGTALGIKLAQPDRPVVAICGDGTLSMAGTEILAAAQAKAGVIYLVMNDQRYGMVELGMDAIFGRSPSFPIGLDIPALAQGLGARCAVIERPGDLLALGTAALSEPSPLVLDVRIDREERMPKSGRFESIRHFVGDAAKPLVEA